MSKLDELLQMNNLESDREVSDKERIKELEKQNEMLTECLMELADIIYA